MFFKGWPDPPDLTVKRGQKHKKKHRHREHKPNPQRLWLKQNPPGSAGRMAWEERKAMKERFRELLASEP